MRQLIQLFKPHVKDEASALLLPPREQLFQHACLFETAEPGAELEACIPEGLRQDVVSAIAKRRMEFLAGRYCAAQAIKAAGVRTSHWVGRASDRSPIWPAGMVGSISHTDDMAMAIVAHESQCKGVGVDIENIMPSRRAARLADKILAGYPYSNIVDDYPLLVTLVFSVKEALYKALYPLSQQLGKIYRGFDEEDVVEWDLDQGKCLIKLREAPLRSSGLGDCFEAEYAYDGKHVQARAVVLSRY